jgi:hypothetical protein
MQTAQFTVAQKDHSKQIKIIDWINITSPHPTPHPRILDLPGVPVVTEGNLPPKLLH